MSPAHESVDWPLACGALVGFVLAPPRSADAPPVVGASSFGTVHALPRLVLGHVARPAASTFALWMTVLGREMLSNRSA